VSGRARALRVDPAWRRRLRMWCADHERSLTDTFTAATIAFLDRDHTGAVYIAPRPSDASVRVGFYTSTTLHQQVVDAFPTLWDNGIRGIRDLYLVAVDLYITPTDDDRQPAAPALEETHS